MAFLFQYGRPVPRNWLDEHHLYPCLNLQELRTLGGQQSDCSSKGDQVGSRLHEDVIAQLKACNSKLLTARGKKNGELQQLLKPVTIGEIIQNEQPAS